MKSKTQEEIECGHPSQSEANRHPDDILLREHGFVIRHRPAKGPAIWIKGDKEYTQDKALRIVNKQRGRTLSGGL